MNSILLASFSLYLLGFLITYARTHRAAAFTFALSACRVLEILGYLGRIISWSNPWNQKGFLLQYICLTIGPTFIAGGIYLSLRNIVRAFGKENSHISPETFTRFFIPCDVLSLVLQALGGGIASTASHEDRSTALGDHIMVAGLAFQTLTLAIFMVWSPSLFTQSGGADTHSRQFVWTSQSELPDDITSSVPHLIPNSRLFARQGSSVDSWLPSPLPPCVFSFVLSTE